MNQPTVVLFVAAILVECGGICVAGSPTEAQASPPIQYALSDVILELSEGDRTIRVYGTGAGTVVHHSPMSGDSSSPFSVLSREVFQVLQLCYRGGFFDLQPHYGPPAEVRLRPDGTVETLTTVAADVPGVAVTVRIGRYRKTVSYLKGLALPPPILEEVHRRIRELSSMGTRSDLRGGRSSNFAIQRPPTGVTSRA